MTRIHKEKPENQETEAKFYVRDLAAAARRLEQMGARLVQPRTHELNLRFDRPDGSLRRAGCALRLRRDAQSRLTYKEPAMRTEGALSRREVEFTVGDFEAAREFLEALGYEVTFRYEKYRTTYALGKAQVMLDELPYGNFVEIEGEMETLRRAAERLGLNWEAAIPTSYHALFERLCAARGLASRELSFANCEGINIPPAQLGVQPADE